MSIDFSRSTRPDRYIKEIDGLRAIAIILVLVFHAFPNHLRGGYVGVDVFFAISGYLITSIISRALENDNFRITRFLLRRIARLLPAMLIVSGAVLLLGAFYILPHAYANIAQENIFAVSFTANVFYFLHAGYFDVAAGQRFFLHYWSLAVEMQLYIFWAALACLSGKYFQRAIAIVGVLSLIYNILWTPHHATATFYLPFSRVWEFSLGAAVLYAEKHYDRPKIIKYPVVISVIGLIFVCLAAYGYNAKTSYPGWRAAIPTLGAALIMYGANLDRMTRKILSHATLSFIGKISYELYLWHWPVLVFIGALDIDGNSHLARLVGLAAAVIASIATYPIETSIRRAINAAVQRLWLPAGSFGALIGLSILIISTQGLPGRFYTAAQPALLQALHKKVKAARSALTSFPLDKCVIGRASSAASRPKTCAEVFDRSKTIVVWGDSHAAHIMPGLVARFGNYRIIPLAQFGCPPLEGWYDRTAPYCLKNNIADLKSVLREKPALVILAANWIDYTFSDVKRGLLDFIKKLQDAGITNIVVMGQAPNWNKDLPSVLQETIVRESKIPARLSHDLNRKIFSIDSELSKAVTAEGADYISVLNSICPSQACPTMTPAGDLMSRDSRHFTRAGSIYVITVLSPFIRRALTEHAEK